MAVKTKVEKNPEGGFSIIIEEDGSGDLNRIMGELCQKHKEAKGRGEELNPQTPKEICQEILQAISIDRYPDGRYYDVEMAGALLKGISEKDIEKV